MVEVKNSKTNEDVKLRIGYLEEIARETFGEGTTTSSVMDGDRMRINVILPNQELLEVYVPGRSSEGEVLHRADSYTQGLKLAKAYSDSLGGIWSLKQ
jgi:hypothetical protein